MPILVICLSILLICGSIEISHKRVISRTFIHIAKQSERNIWTYLGFCGINLVMAWGIIRLLGGELF